MDVRIEGAHEQALLRLMQHNNEKTAVAMTRMLIRDAAKEAGLWPTANEHSGYEAVSQIEVTPITSQSDS